MTAQEMSDLQAAAEKLAGDKGNCSIACETFCELVKLAARAAGTPTVGPKPDAAKPDKPKS